MNIKYILLVIISIFIMQTIKSQDDDLMDLFGDDANTKQYTEATFKTTFLVIGQSVENPPNGNLIFNVQHRFGSVNSGLYDFFGLDQANTRIGFQYGINDLLSVGIGRSSYRKTYDGWVKFKILRQSTGPKSMPVSITYYGNAAISALKWPEPERTNYFSSRLSYANQLLIARKLTPGVSIQLMPTHLHYNLVETKEDENDIFSIGAGGRFKLNKRVSVNVEYYYLLSERARKQYNDAFSIGFDIETGGHVFQLYFTNSQGIIEQHFVGQTSGNWLNGDIHFGFNISRAFTIKKPKEFAD